jgi:hypothetical protein
MRRLRLCADGYESAGPRQCAALGAQPSQGGALAAAQEAVTLMLRKSQIPNGGLRTSQT